MKFIEFLNENINSNITLDEANSEAAAKEIHYIDVDEDVDGEVTIIIEFADKNIKEFKAIYFADIFGLDLSDANFNKGKLKVTLNDEDGNIAKNIKKIAKENDIEYA